MLRKIQLHLDFGHNLDRLSQPGPDQAAAAVIGLRALEAGNEWLEKHSQTLADQKRARLQINRKSKFGCTVTTDGILIDRQLEAGPAGDNPSLDMVTDTHRFQNRVARVISGLSKAMGAHLSKQEWVPGCWKRSGSPADPWHPLCPETMLRRVQDPNPQV